MCLFCALLLYFVFGTGWYVPAHLIVEGLVPSKTGQLEISWDSGAGWNDYEKEIFPIHTKTSDCTNETHHIIIRALGEKNSASAGTQVVCNQILIDGEKIDLSMLSTSGRLTDKGIRLSNTDDSISLSSPAKKQISIELLTNNYSGKVEIAVNDRRDVHDLYVANEEAKQKTFDYWVVQPGGEFTVSMYLPRYRIKTLQLRSIDPRHPIHVKNIAIKSKKRDVTLNTDLINSLKTVQFTEVNNGLKRYFKFSQFIYQIIFAALSTWIFLVVYGLIIRCGGLFSAFFEKQRHVFWLFFLGAFSVFSLWLIAFWPGVMSVDSLKVWRAARLPEVLINDHPLLFVLLYTYLQHVWDHVAVVPLFHITLCSLLTAYLAFYLYRQKVSLYLVLLFYIIVIFSVPAGLYNIVLWKDIPFALLIVFWAFFLADLYMRKRCGQLSFTKQQIFSLVLLYLALGLIRHNGLIYLGVIPLFLVMFRIVRVKYIAVGFTIIAVLTLSSFFFLQSKMHVEDAGYLVGKIERFIKPVTDRSVTQELVRTGKQYWGILDINQTQSKWDKWHYFVRDRIAYWFLRHSGWYDVYPYAGSNSPISKGLLNLCDKLYWNSYKSPWVYFTWNPFYLVALFPITVVLFRWLPLSAIFSAFILVQVFALLGVINIMNWRYYYFAYVGAIFLPFMLLWDFRNLRLSLLGKDQ